MSTSFPVEQDQDVALLEADDFDPASDEDGEDAGDD